MSNLSVPATVVRAPAPARLPVTGMTHGAPNQRARSRAVTPIPEGPDGSPPAVLLAAAAALLVYRITGQNDLLLGVRTGVSDTRVLRIFVAGSAPTSELVGLVRQEWETTKPMALADLLDARVNVESLPGAPCHAAVDTTGSDHDELIRWSGIGLVTASSAPHATVLVMDSGLAADGDVEQVARLAGSAIAAVCRDDVTIDAAPLLDPAERHRQLHHWNDTERATPATWLPDSVAAHAVAQPDSLAVAEPGRAISYAELDDRADRLATYLHTCGVRSGARVAVCLERGIDNVVAQLAVMRTGSAVVLLDPQYPAERRDHILTDSRAVGLLTRVGLLDDVTAGPCSTIAVDRDLSWAELPKNPPSPSIDDFTICHVAYTSGSTGRPKAVLQRHGGQRNLAHDLIARCSITTSSRGSWLSSPGFGLVEVDPFPVLFAGGSVHVPGPEVAASPELLRNWLVTERITDALLLTAMAERVWVLPWPDGGTLRTMRIAGERLRMWPPAGLPFDVVNIYGTAEATVVATCELTALAARLGDGRLAVGPPVGRPVANVRMYVLDGNLEPVPPGTVGELYTSGRNLAAGYGRHSDTVERFLDNPIEGDPYPTLYRTGDRARYWGDGCVEVVGRADAEVKIRGYRVHLGEIETAVTAHQGVAQACVVAREDPGWDRRLVAYVLPEPGRDVDADLVDLRTGLRATLAPYMIPAAYVVVAEFPLSPNGKIDTAALPEPTATRPALAVAFRAARDDTEQLLQQLWSEVLGISGIGIDDDFVELGGDSLKAMSLITLLRDRAGADVGLSDLHAAATITQLAPLVAGRAGTAVEAWTQIVPAPLVAHEPFPLTDVQQALWIGRTNAVDYGQVGAHGYFEYEQIDFDVARFRAAWARLVERHDMLRAVLLRNGTQQVLPEAPFDPVTVEDLRSVDTDSAWDRALEVRQEMSHQVIDAHCWPLFDIRVTLLPGGIARLHFGLDMLLLDAWSAFQVLFDELIRLYEDPDVDLPIIEVTFRDYVLGARQALAGSRALETARNYWFGRLDALPPAPDLPTVVPPPEEATRFDRLETFLEPDRWARLQERAAGAGVTPSGILVATFAEVLRAWSSSPHFTINFPIFDRMPLHPQVDALLGDFTNTVLVAVESSDGAFQDRAHSLQQQLWRDLEHRHLNGVEVLREITRRNGGGIGPGMPIVVTSLLGQPDRRQVSALGTETFGISQTPQVLLDVQIRQIDDVLHVKWDYLGAHFPPGLVDAMFGAFATLLDLLVDDTDAWGKEQFDLLPAEQLAIRAAANDTAEPVQEIVLQDLLARQIQLRPQAQAIVAADRVLSYGQLGDEVARLASRLRGQGARPDSLVAVVLPKGWEQYVAVWATIVAGGAYLPIDPEVPEERLRFLLADGQVELVLTTPELATSVSWPDDVHVMEVTAGTGGDPVSLPTPLQKPDDLAYVIYTSGSTGTPKGVMVAHRGVVNHVTDVIRRMSVDENDRVLATAALQHDLSVFDMLGVLAAGATVVVPPPSDRPDPDLWAELVRREQVTFWAAVPAIADMLATRIESRDGPPMPSLSRVVLAGDWIPLNLPDRLRALAPGVQIISCGGPTETINLSIVYPIGEVDPRWSSIPYGKPMANHRYHILDAELRARPEWVPGQMWVGSEIGLARGYWNDAERTAEKFRELPATGERVFATGDVGRYLPDGTIEILGRDDFQVKINGHRIELGEIESTARRHAGVDAAVAVAAGTGRGRRLVLFVSPVAAGTPPDPLEVAAFLADRLPRPLVPSDVRIMETLPITRNGKIDRGALTQEADHGAADSDSPTADGTPFEELLAEIYAEVLELPACSTDTNFFRAGGDSVAGMHLAARLEELIGAPVPVRAVLLSTTPVALARALADDPQIGPTVVAVAETLAALDDEDIHAAIS